MDTGIPCLAAGGRHVRIPTAASTQGWCAGVREILSRLQKV